MSANADADADANADIDANTNTDTDTDVNTNPNTNHSETLTLDTSSLFLKSYSSFSEESPSSHPPLTFSLLSSNSPLPPIPSSFPIPNLIPSTRFVVDSFRSDSPDFSVSFFLSHFHSDHYSGLSPSWSRGLVFCSHLTARLLLCSLHLSRHFVVPLPLDQPLLIDGCQLTLVDANHCPGAVLFLFHVNGLRYILLDI